MNSAFWLYNGEVLPADRFPEVPEGLRDWGYFFVEEMHVAANRIFFLKEHLQQIQINLDLFEMPVPIPFQGEGIAFQRMVSRLLNKNKYYLGAAIRLYLFEDGWCVLPEPMPNREYTINEEGLTVDLFDRMTKPVHPLSTVHSGTAALWSIAARYARKKGISNCLVQNDRGFLCEAAGSNLFVLKGEWLETPSLECGTYHDVIREKVMQAARDAGLKVKSSEELTFEEAQNADELFIANAAQGIQWIKGIHERRYYCRRILDINRELNRLTAIN